MDKSLRGILETKEYDFLRENKNLKRNVCLLTLGGSHAYGTNVEGSDVDVRGVATRKANDILLGRDFEAIVNETTDTTIYSFDKIVSLLENCNPNIIEILGLPEEDYFVLEGAGRLLYDNKDLFLSKRCVQSFGGYANSQLYRLKQRSSYLMDNAEFNDHIRKRVKKIEESLREAYGTNFSFSSDENGVYVTGSFDRMELSALSDVLNAINTTHRAYRNRSQRNEKAMTHGKIAKHAMHLIRLYMMGTEILEEGVIRTRRDKEHDLLMEIRNGRFLDKEGAPTEEMFDIVKEYEERFDKAAKVSLLPDNPDMKKIDEIRIAVNKSVVKKRPLLFEKREEQDAEMERER